MQQIVGMRRETRSHVELVQTVPMFKWWGPDELVVTCSGEEYCFRNLKGRRWVCQKNHSGLTLKFSEHMFIFLCNQGQYVRSHMRNMGWATSGLITVHGPIAWHILLERFAALDAPHLSSENRAVLQEFLQGAQLLL